MPGSIAGDSLARTQLNRQSLGTIPSSPHNLALSLDETFVSEKLLASVLGYHRNPVDHWRAAAAKDDDRERAAGSKGQSYPALGKARASGN
jgi:hypothetical protein